MRTALVVAALSLAACEASPDPAPARDASVDEGPQIVDTTAPRLTLESREGVRWVQTLETTLRGTVEDDDTAVALSVTVGGSRVDVTNGATLPAFEFVVTVPAGRSIATVRATDRGGNTSEASVTLHAGNTVAAGLSQSGLLRDGRVQTWGGNTSGDLGRTTMGNDPTPARANVGDGVTSLAFVSSSAGSFALNDRGEVLHWGTARETAPSVVAGIENAVHLAAGPSHRIVLRRDGTLAGWGSNAAGQLGAGESGNVAVPTRIEMPGRVVSVCVGSAHTAAVTDDGTVWSFGSNTSGQLGHGAVDQSRHERPEAVEPISTAVAVACGRDHTLCLLRDGTLLAWGTGTSGQIGNGTGATAVLPSRVSALTHVRHIAAGGNTSWALNAEGQLFGWGQNSFGQLGVGSSAGRNAPVPITMLSPVFQVASGGLHSVFTTRDGRVYAVGSNGSTQLGRMGASSYVPVEVVVP